MKPEELGQILVQMGESDETAALWNVVTALRGPDNGDEDLKRATTEVIRWKLLGKPTDRLHFSGSYLAPDSGVGLQRRTHYSLGEFEASHHFLRHAQWAFKALGLKWDEVNT